ncbi:MAG: 30S ribosomal protein S15 [Prosthecochloris sp.]|uniref:Small ribosomal subunit protein uS15 n=1 Tax=Prosthecochloris aestuarii (strain DSM 271 / SK 413) TaxID=290512 RepID=RS15_PROA2|nr:MULTISPECIES: 30S ribosomal protein S15 [Prosthecochloris]B4S4T0.1 RecName: Full=Small ribosomal subunit protein uS15; AltName: Full=30S ribosomal protein S15 [Prosthecochloris aestuarii DSM 271]ACF45428.1 ribosomal protein S15 [Prosthecochloris aestuarii DSM 271]MCW8798413.1 30S ribosomal protein S15 [Prosthecochloris sp.]NEX12392.1 30S ribosomal protein S15 [Prosthecochloris sp.]RDD31379.1 30S ribosomal protein S15 [Prosthecochloris sp. ZM]
MSLTKEKKAEIINTFGGSDKNTGKTEVQIALYSRRISDLTGHLKEHPKDKHSRHGLLKLVGKRKSLLAYLKNTEIERYRQVLADLDLRK